MTRDDIIRMAMEVVWYSGNRRTPATGNMIVRRLEKFAILVAEHERESCAKASEAQIDRWIDDRARYADSGCANAIRQRGKE